MLISGTIPDSLQTLSLLEYLYLDHNILSGTISNMIADHVSELTLIWFHVNCLSGTLPSNLGNLQQMLTIKLSQNYLTGSLPFSLSNMTQLEQIFLFENQLTGNLDVFNQMANNSYKLNTVLMQNNGFIGDLPNTLFSSQSLVAFSVSTNCITGAITETVCNAKSLTSFVVDGLNAAPHCQNNLFVNPNQHVSSYVLSATDNSLPLCLFAMPNLATLHLSGNAITGKLSDVNEISDTLVELSLSHNKIDGTIPVMFQNRFWTSLDLSFNKLSGELYSSFYPFGANTSLYLQVNRLSGKIPNTLRYANDLSILKGNLFQCSLDRSELPVSVIVFIICY